MRLLQLRYFRDVAKTLSISKSAAIHHIPQPAMSKSIIDLENELGTPLFDRINKRLRITEAGRLFLESIDQMFFHLEKGVSLVQSYNSLELSGEINLLVKQSNLMVTDCIASFLEQHPRVKFNVFSSANQTNDNVIDFCIGASDSVLGFDQRMTLIHNRVMLAVPPGHKLADNKNVLLYETVNENVLSLGPDTPLWQTVIDHCHKAGFNPNVRVYCSDVFSFESLFRTGKYISFLPGRTDSSLFLSKEAIAVPTNPAIFIHTDLIWDSRHALSPVAEAFHNYIEVYCSTLTRSSLVSN